MLETLKLSCFPENPSKFFIKHTFIWRRGAFLSRSLRISQCQPKAWWEHVWICTLIPSAPFESFGQGLARFAISLTPHVISTGCLHPASFQKLAKGMDCEFVGGEFFGIHAPCSLSQGVDSLTLKLSYKRAKEFISSAKLCAFYAFCLPSVQMKLHNSRSRTFAVAPQEGLLFST